MKEIIISIYDGGWQWSIAKYEDDKYYITTNVNKYETLCAVDQMIYDSEIIRWNDDSLRIDIAIKKLTDLGYERIIICEDGNVEIYINGANV